LIPRRPGLFFQQQKQALHLPEALAPGEKDASEIVKSIAGGKVRELV
jgi:hypothetical protein